MFLVKRPNSQNWQLEIRFPRDFIFSMFSGPMFKFRRHFTMSLGTPDRAEAEIKAAPYIHQYRIWMYDWKFRKDDALRRNARGFSQDFFEDFADTPMKKTDHLQHISTALPDGLHFIDGQQAVVFGQTVTFFSPDGKPLRTEPNSQRLTVKAMRVEDEKTAEAFLYFDPDAVLPARYQREKTHPDDDIIEAYIRDRKLRPAIAADARSTWRLYKQVIGKRLSKATRKDGKLFAAHLSDLGLARATVQKKIGWLAAACAHGLDNDANLTSNPFTRVLPPGSAGDAMKRRAFSEKEMEGCFSKLSLLSEKDKILWLLLAKTGMRLGEAMSIDKESQERGTNIRYVVIGTKTDSSLRHVPLPLDIGLPEQIAGQLFPGTAAAASKRLNRFIKSSVEGCTPDLVVHSLRHRAAEVFRLVDNGADPFLRRRLLGHAASDVHDKYGSFGPPMTILKRMIDANPIDGTLKIA